MTRGVVNRYLQTGERRAASGALSLPDRSSAKVRPVAQPVKAGSGSSGYRSNRDEFARRRGDAPKESPGRSVRFDFPYDRPAIPPRSPPTAAPTAALATAGPASSHDRQFSRVKYQPLTPPTTIPMATPTAVAGPFRMGRRRLRSSDVLSCQVALAYAGEKPSATVERTCARAGAPATSRSVSAYADRADAPRITADLPAPPSPCAPSCSRWAPCPPAWARRAAAARDAAPRPWCSRR